LPWSRPSTYLQWRVPRTRSRFIWHQVSSRDIVRFDHSLSSGQFWYGHSPIHGVGSPWRRRIQGKIKHEYEHDAQSFIWVPIWICLRYNKGGLGKPNELLDDWLKVDALGCRDKRSSGFLTGKDSQIQVPGTGHEDNWKAATECIHELVLYLAGLKKARKQFQHPDIDTAFAILLENPITPFLC
jgi:hypothetical protein